MGCKCGTQVILCNLPVRFDTYKGCSHGCKYCFAQKKANIAKIQRDETVEALRSFVEGKRGRETAWCDWNIPIHWGGMSDPFQPIEKNIRASYECLKLLAETKCPFVVSTKGKLVADEEYLSLLEKCNCVVQISMVCSKYGEAGNREEDCAEGTESYHSDSAVYAGGFQGRYEEYSETGRGRSLWRGFGGHEVLQRKAGHGKNRRRPLLSSARAEKGF
mgnify:CR=1 FL=1